MSNRAYSHAFSGGEVTPEFWGQIGDAKFQTGLALCRNFRVLPHGPVQNRAGFEFVREVKDSTKATRLLPFEYSTTQTMVLEMGNLYTRFHTQGATLMSGAVPYEVATSYAEANLFGINFVQSADVLTLVHTSYAPSELRRLAALNWTIGAISFAATILPPTGAFAVATPGGTPGTPITHEYAITSVAGNNIDESLISVSASCSNNLFDSGASNLITWVAAAGALRYNVYKKSNGLWGYLGQASGAAFTDDNITPDIGKTPPEVNTPFPAGGTILSVPVTAGGTGYNTAPISGGAISAVSVTAGGSLYGASPSLTVSDPTGSGATFTVTATLGIITSVSVGSGGSNYTDPVFSFTSPTGSGARVSPTITPRINVAATLTVTDAGGGTGAVLAPVISGGAIVGVTVQSPGSGYVNPVVTVGVAAGGSDATFGTPVLSAGGDYPGAVTYFDQRRVFAGTINKPQNLWLTRSGTESNLSYSIPTRDADSIAFRVVARQANTVRHLVPLTNLVALTSSAEWRVTSVNSDAVTPTSIDVKPQSYVGAGTAQPVIVNNNVLYAAARGGHMREMAWQYQAGGYVTGDLSLRAPHLFDGLSIVDMAFSKAPYPTVWAVSSNGKLLGLTYVPEQQIGAWHQHDTDGAFESIAVVAEGNEDVLYAVIRRTINGASKRYVERMRPRAFATQADCFFVDCGATYDATISNAGVPVTTISGITWLEGKTINILADGAVHDQRVVTGGAFTLDFPATKVQFGLPITADLQTLPLALQVEGFAQGKPKNVNKVFIRVKDSSGIFAGPSLDRLTEAKIRTDEPYGSPPRLQTRVIEVVNKGAWTDDGQVFVRQVNPLPMTITALTLDVAIGG